MQKATDEDIATIIRVCHGHDKTCQVFDFVNEEIGFVALDEAPEWLRDVEAIATVAGSGPLYWAALDRDMRLIKFLDLGLGGGLNKDHLAYMLKVKRLEIALRSRFPAQYKYTKR